MALALRRLGRLAGRNAVPVLVTERAGRVLGERVAVALPVRGPEECGDDFEVPVRDVEGLAPEVGEAEVDVELEQVDSGRALWHGEKRRKRVGRHTALPRMGEIRYGPSGLPEAPTFEEAFAALAAEGYRACEIGFASGFWLDYEAAPLFAAAADAADVALSVHAPLAAFMGHADRGKKFKMALGMLDHTAGSPRPAARG